MPLYFFLCPTLLVACPPDGPIQAKDAIEEINSLLDESNNVSAPKVVPKTSKKRYEYPSFRRRIFTLRKSNFIGKQCKIFS